MPSGCEVCKTEELISAIWNTDKRPINAYGVFINIDIDIRVFVNCNWVVTRWQQYSTHLHTNNTQNNTINNFGWEAFWDSNPEWSNYN